jgi:uncharacterized protein (TIGR00251 family)
VGAARRPVADTTAATTTPWTIAPGGLVLTVRLTPKGGRDAIDGIETMADGRTVLKVRVRAAASDGEANAALLRTMAKAMGVAPRSIDLIAGATSRIKRLRIDGAAPVLVAMLEKACAIG